MGENCSRLSAHFWIFYVVLVYVAGLSVRQSIVLAVLFTSASRGLERAAGKPLRRFTPYYVRIKPRWHLLLADFKLISKPEEWHAIQESFNEKPSSEYRVLRDVLFFTVVDQAEDFERTSIYWNNHRCFVSNVKFEEDMEPIQVERESDVEFLRRSGVRFFMKVGMDGYKLGIRVADWWWEERKASCPKRLSSS